MDVIGLTRALRRRWLFVIGGLLLGLVAAAALLALSTPIYTGTAQVLISTTPTANATTNDLAQSGTFTRQEVVTYARLVTTPLVLQPVRRDLGLDISEGDLAGKISADAPTNLSFVSVTASDPDRDTAAELANAVADSLVVTIAQLQATPDGSPTPVQATIAEPAQPPGSPASPNVMLIVALGVIAGLAAGVGAGLLRDRTDRLIRDRRDVTRISGAPILGSIPVDPPRSGTADSAGSRLRPPAREAIRHLRTAVFALGMERRVLVVTSSVPQEGKTMIATQLAMAAATAGPRVLLIDADMRRNRPDATTGLSEVLSGQIGPEDAVFTRPNVPRLDVLPSGTTVPNPSELLESPAMGRLLDEVRDRYDLVLVDVPALLPYTDAAVVGRLVDGVLVVVGRDRVDEDDLLDACTTLDGVRATPIGFVVNYSAVPRRAHRRRRRRSSRSEGTWTDESVRARTAVQPFEQELRGADVGAGEGNHAAGQSAVSSTP